MFLDSRGSVGSVSTIIHVEENITEGSLCQVFTSQITVPTTLFTCLSNTEMTKNILPLTPLSCLCMWRVT